MSFLRRKPADEPAAEPVVEPTPEPPADGKKGRPTPKRREAEGRTRGPVAPPPKTQREAMKRSKEQRSSMSKDERRAAARTNRERMMAGDERYLLPRDRGKVRAYVRDLVDARRNVAGILLPIAVLSFVILLVPVQLIQAYGPLVLLVAIAAAVIDSIIFGRQISKKVAAKFPQGDSSGQSTKGYSLGFYAFNRACLIRRWRAPRPRVETGQQID
ncbi:DUF3043 domain-containing protein [Nakamurella multipartita]|uniref:Integral membrane protein n=1 Tax=Nakamurella multipartita (strain ATCC 700099 / DSM 44233 / CIP 104796 / JCM 9543 / NBRC 105858 / Y-104) TaxID=479431 RepID=C8XCY7_NAKMY|nr:DUF3043 domain-containing protein [Nakamurella multipartita]ACV79590.1 hypothetical protein Namu_3259 [Nakamurella multipartita DSM 44233]HOZ60011.1 DUF3043 domain-containing protein [Nakamurella multipartita]